MSGALCWHLLHTQTQTQTHTVTSRIGSVLSCLTHSNKNSRKTGFNRTNAFNVSLVVNGMLNRAVDSAFNLFYVSFPSLFGGVRGICCTFKKKTKTKTNKRTQTDREVQFIEKKLNENEISSAQFKWEKFKTLRKFSYKCVLRNINVCIPSNAFNTKLNDSICWGRLRSECENKSIAMIEIRANKMRPNQLTFRRVSNIVVTPDQTQRCSTFSR